MSYYALIVQLVVSFVCVPPFIFADDILGCGGFVKSEVKINFSLIEVTSPADRCPAPKSKRLNKLYQLFYS